MALHPDGDIVATGQMAAKEVTSWNRGKNKEGKLVNIMIWKASTQEKMMEIHGFLRRAVKHLQFSPDGKKLLGIGADDHSSLVVYDWANGTMLANTKTDPGGVYSVCWKDNTIFATCGSKHVMTYTQSGQAISKAKLPYIKQVGNLANTACCFVKGKLYSGN
jgi:ribulose kinase